MAAYRTLAPSPLVPAILTLDGDSHVLIRACRTLERGACPRRRPQRPRTGGLCRDRPCGRRLGLRRGRIAALEGALSGLHVREGWHMLVCSTLTGCAIACREGAAWHRSARTALAVHIELRSRTVTQDASGRARLSMCLRLRVCRCIRWSMYGGISDSRSIIRWSFFRTAPSIHVLPR